MHFNVIIIKSLGTSKAESFMIMITTVERILKNPIYRARSDITTLSLILKCTEAFITKREEKQLIKKEQRERDIAYNQTQLRYVRECIAAHRVLQVAIKDARA